MCGVHLRPERPLTGPEIAKNVSERVFLAVCKKVPENTRKNHKIPEIGHCGVSFALSGIVEDVLQTPRKTLFETCFAISGLEAETAVNGTQTPEQASKKSLWFPEDSWKPRLGGSVYSQELSSTTARLLIYSASA